MAISEERQSAAATGPPVPADDAPEVLAADSGDGRTGRLWIHRRIGESLTVGQAKVTVAMIDQRHKVVSLLIEAPQSIRVNRTEWRDQHGDASRGS